MYRHHPQTSDDRASSSATARSGELLTVRASFSFALTDLTNVRALPELDGGALMDVGCYCVSGSRLVAGRAGARPRRAGRRRDRDRHGAVRHAALPGDVVAQIEASFLAPERQALEVVGRGGRASRARAVAVDWGGDLVLERDGEKEVVAVEAADSYTRQLENLADAIAGRAPALLGRADAVAQARVIDALYRSAATGCRSRSERSVSAVDRDCRLDSERGAQEAQEVPARDGGDLLRAPAPFVERLHERRVALRA